MSIEPPDWLDLMLLPYMPVEAAPPCDFEPSQQEPTELEQPDPCEMTPDEHYEISENDYPNRRI